MGDLLFKVPTSLAEQSQIWETSYITGIDGIPWQSHHNIRGDQFSIGRQIDESGKVTLALPTETHGTVALSTTSLRISGREYDLLIELARGTVDRVRTQTAEWQRIGLRLPEEYFPKAEACLDSFLQAATARDSQQASAEFARRAIDQALSLSVWLCEIYSAQALEARRNSEGRLPTLLGARLSEPDISSVQKTLSKTFNCVNVVPGLANVESQSGRQDFSTFDSQIEWANAQGKKVCAGPLVDFGPGGLPKWMVLLSEGFDSVYAAACQHARSCTQRYQGRVHIWNCAAGLNIPGDLRWTDEETLRLAVGIIDTVRQADDRCPVLLTIDQPWCEYLRNDNEGISPINFADALIRADLGLGGIVLDLDFAQRDFNYYRDPIEVSHLIDRWSMLGLPLMVNLTWPLRKEQPTAETSQTSSSDIPGSFNAETVVKLLLAKPSVHAINWKCLLDGKLAQSSSLPCGLWNDRGKPNPLLKPLAELRNKFLH